MRKLVKYDLYRTFYQVSTYVLFAITLIFAVISAADATFFSGEAGNGLLLTFGNTLAGGKDIMLMLSGCMCGMLIGEDFSVGSYGLSVSSGYHRRKILGGRTVSCFIVISLMMAEYMLISAAFSVIYVKTFASSDVLRLVALSLVHIVHFCMENMICILLCFVLKKKVNATAVCLFFNVLFISLFGLLCSKIERLTVLFTKTVPIITYTMFGGNEKMLTVLLSTLVYGIVAAAVFLVTCRIFDKEELK